MNILMLSSSLRSGGAETHICELASALARREHRIFVATSGGALAETLASRGVRHIEMPLNSKAPLSILKSVKKLRALLKKERFDIIHTHSRIASFVCKIAVGKKKIPIVSTVHSHFKITPLLRRFSFWGRRSIAVSEDLREYLCREYKISRDKITVIPNGIDTEKFSPNYAADKQNAPHVLFASRLDADCSLGALLLCKIAPALAEKFPKIKIELAGGGKEYRRLSFLANKVNERIGYDCVSLCGYVDNMPEKLRRTDVFVGVSRAALEAMSCAVPTVLCGNEGFIGVLDASRISTAANTNFCCRGSELPISLSLYDAVSTLLEMKSDERRELGRYLRGYVEKNNSISSLAEKTEKFYLGALSEDKKKHSSFVICGYYGFGNLGDDAMLASIIKQLRAAHPKKTLCVIAHRPRRISALTGTQSVSRENIFAVKKAIRQADKLILGGGSILQDKSSLRSLVFYTSLIKYAHRHGTRVELWANGLGPFRRRISKKLASRALERCSRISLRDGASISLAVSLGIPRDKLTLDDDLSSSVLPCEEERAKELLEELSLKEKRFSLIAIRKRDGRKVKKQLVSYLRVLGFEGITPLFVVMHDTEDKKISRRWAKRFGGVCAPKLSPEELCGIIPHAHSALGTRYHLLYLAKRANIPIKAFGDDPKICSL